MATIPCVTSPASQGSDAQSALSHNAAVAITDAVHRRRAGAVERKAALGEMTGGIAHDFRNILAVIESGLNMASRFNDDPAMLRSSLEAAHDGVQRGLRMTSRLLSFAKPREDRASAANVSDLLRGLEAFIRYSVGPGIQIRLALSSGIPDCFLDSSQFNAAILNLVVNARDAMPDGGVIEISTELLDGHECSSATESCPVVRVRVKDNGLGMSPDVQNRIFDPYFTTKGDTGTGLGVPQVGAFMKRVSGSVKVESAIGVGTMFDLMFPVQRGTSLADPKLWRQIDRWVNEGGAESHESSSSVKTSPERC